MHKPVGSMDRRQAALRPTPAAPVVASDDKDRSQPKPGRIIEFMNGINHSRG